MRSILLTMRIVFGTNSSKRTFLGSSLVKLGESKSCNNCSLREQL